MKPKGKLLVLVLVFGGIAVAAGTGAFSTVEAERTATVDVTGDANALLAISEADDISAGAVNDADDGAATIDLSESALGDASGLNPDARTVLTPLVNVTNNGGNPVDLNVSVANVDDDDVSVTIVDADREEFTEQNLTPGSSTQFGLAIDVDGDTPESFQIDIQIEANESS